MEWIKSQTDTDSRIKIPFNWLKIEYFEALNVLFRIENALRVFVYIILKGELGEKWDELSLANDDGKQTTIKAIAKKRLTQDKNYAYLGYVLGSPLVHLTSGELIRIITAESYWQYFKPYFQGSKEIIKTKLDEIGNVRNSLAHFRPIKKEDIELVKSNSVHILSSIEKLIIQFIDCPDIVPTNTDESWYKELSQLKSENNTVIFTQSKDEKWVKIRLTYSCPIINISGVGDYRTCQVTNIRTDRVLISYSKLTSLLVCVCESNPSNYVKPDKLKFSKRLTFTFKREKLISELSAIKEEFLRLITQIDEETQLIEKDSLARGKLVELVTLSMSKDNTTYFHIKATPFTTSLSEDTPVEFWGELIYASDHFITSTHIYPWMQIEISEADLPF